MSHSAAMRRDKSSSSFFSPLLKRTFSSSTTSPGATTTPSSQSRLSAVGTPKSCVSRRATGARENSSANLPSCGRPRCDITMTRAFAASAAWMVGSAARMRASLPTSPSLMGTFRSSRISTRLSFRSRPVILMIFMDFGRRPPSFDLGPGSDGVEHAVGKTPFIVVPGADLHERALDYLGERRIVDRGVRVVVEIDRHERLIVVRENALQGSAGSRLDQFVDLVDGGLTGGGKRQVDQRHV